MDLSRETPDVTTKPKRYDLTNIFVRRDAGGEASEADSEMSRGMNAAPNQTVPWSYCAVA